MTFLPIVGRELRVASRRRGTYLNRELAALSAILVFAGTLLIDGRAAPPGMGSVSIGEFWRMTLVLANTLFFSLAAGIFVSATSRSARKAMAGTVLLILLIHAVFPAIGAWVAFRQAANSVNTAFLLPSVGYAY